MSRFGSRVTLLAEDDIPELHRMKHQRWPNASIEGPLVNKLERTNRFIGPRESDTLAWRRVLHHKVEKSRELGSTLAGSAPDAQRILFVRSIKRRSADSTPRNDRSSSRSSGRSLTA